MQNTEQIIYKQESKHILSAVKYKFGRQVSHKYYFYPDGTLAKVEMMHSWFLHNNPYTDTFDPDYNREDFSYTKILFLIIISFPCMFFACGFIMLPHFLVVGMHHIYWHNKKYKFTTKEQQQFKNLTDNI